MRLTSPFPLGMAHFTCIGLPPVEFTRLAARVGYRRIGLRLHPAFPGAPSYAVPEGSAVARDLAAILDGEGLSVFDIEFVVIDADFTASALGRTLSEAASLGAKRLSVCCDDPDDARLVANVAALCDLAAGAGMAVDVECMAWRRVARLEQAIRVIGAAGRPNAGVLVDALHLSRGDDTPDALRGVDPALVRHAQLCDAGPVRPAASDGLIAEARGGRLLPGEGHLPLIAMVDALPSDTILSVEVPMDGSRPAEEHVRSVFEAAQSLAMASR